MKKRILSILLVVAMLAVMIPAFAVASSAEDAVSEVTVTDWTAKEITLYTADDFVEFKKQLTTKNFTGQTVKLGADIDLSTVNTVVSGEYKRNVEQTVATGGFQGIFDGQFHTIKNLVSVHPGANYGLFGKISPSNDGSGTYSGSPVTLKNFAIVDSEISIGDNSALLYMQVRGGNITMENIYIGTDITFSNKTGTDGNAVFVNNVTRTANITFKNCVYDGTITSNHTMYSVFFNYVMTKDPNMRVENCLIAQGTAVPYDVNRTTKNSSGLVHGAMTAEKTTGVNNVRYTESGLVDAMTGVAVEAPEGYVMSTAGYPVPAKTLPMVENNVDTTNTTTWFKGIQYNAELKAIRFVGLVNGELADFGSVGFEIYAYGPTGVMEKLDLNVNAVYTSITEADGSKTAEELGASYIYVANLGGIQEGKGVATFVVKTYSVDANNVKTYTDQQTVTFGTVAG